MKPLQKGAPMGINRLGRLVLAVIAFVATLGLLPMSAASASCSTITRLSHENQKAGSDWWEFSFSPNTDNVVASGVTFDNNTQSYSTTDFVTAAYFSDSSFKYVVVTWFDYYSGEGGQDAHFYVDYANC